MTRNEEEVRRDDMMKDSTNSDDDDDEIISSSSLRSREENEIRDDANNNPITITSTKTIKEVRRVKALSVVVLILSIAGAIGVFFYTKSSEQQQFENQFHDDANKVLGSLLCSMERKLGAFNTLATSFVTMAQMSNQTFPFVRIRNYAAQVARTLQTTNAVTTCFVPVVKPEQRRQWENYASSQNDTIWQIINETFNYQRNFDQYYGPPPESYNLTFQNRIYSDVGVEPYNVTRIYIPGWQSFPLVTRTYAAANYDWYTVLEPDTINGMMDKKEAFLSRTKLIDKPDDPVVTATNKLWCEYYADYLPPDENCLEPIVFWYYPVVDKIDYIDITTNPQYPDEYEVKGFIISDIYWKHLIRDILSPNSKGIVVVFEHELYKEQFTYQIDGPTARFIGGGDHHDPKYSNMRISQSLFDLDAYRIGTAEYYGLPMYLSNNNTYTIYVYPSDESKEGYTTNKPIIFAVSAVAFILLPFLVFLIYDRIIKKQQEEILSTANRSHAIVSSLFPANVRAQLFPPPEQHDNNNYNNKRRTSISHIISPLSSSPQLLGPPIAELYPETTVLFCDIANFTKWSSLRDPTQVFILLESLYGAFDVLANRRNVFKVETIGDCYVAVAGLPDPRSDHAEVMARFAHDLLRKMMRVTIDLEKTLGPGTSSLQMRIGLNSGPTTAGVLRGAKSRFQLFGDTVNTAARMETNSLPGKILCSQKTADILIASGKERWVKPRDGLVHAKGKGMMQCYWIIIKKLAPTSDASSSSYSGDDNISREFHFDSPEVTWMAEVLKNQLIKVISQRVQSTASDVDIPIEQYIDYTMCPRDEVSESIVFPIASDEQSQRTISQVVPISETEEQQLHEYVYAIAQLYRKNPFHNFAHASHVVMSTKKLLNRVVKPIEGLPSTTAYGISSDALAQFAIVFGALIHDVDHPGVSNMQLVKEDHPFAVRYSNKSVAEQNSVTVAWDLLMQAQFADFRALIMPTESESRRFRKLIINLVLATDLFDKELMQQRETRWSHVFDSNNHSSVLTNTSDEFSHRATIIVEHLIQASDVSHTMQHWHVYQEWNRCLFTEMYKAYIDGRADKDPSIGWYDGELWFFDNYIIPLAKKLETCGVFGVSCGELLDYAHDNRAEWAAKGRRIVEENLNSVKSEIANQK